MDSVEFWILVSFGILVGIGFLRAVCSAASPEQY